jgi:hypothetical protein
MSPTSPPPPPPPALDSIVTSSGTCGTRRRRRGERLCIELVAVAIDQYNYNYNCITFAFPKSNRWPQSWATGARKEGLGLDRGYDSWHVHRYGTGRIRLLAACLYYIESWAIRIHRSITVIYSLDHSHEQRPTVERGWSQLYDQSNYYSSVH